jgi:hypothetical protein
VQVAVVGDGEAVHPELAHVRDQLGDAVRPVEERVLGMGMEVYEGHD